MLPCICATTLDSNFKKCPAMIHRWCSMNLNGFKLNLHYPAATNSSTTINLSLWTKVVAHYFCTSHFVEIVNNTLLYIRFYIYCFSSCVLGNRQTVSIINKQAVTCDQLYGVCLSNTWKFLKTDAAGWRHIYSKCVTVSTTEGFCVSR